MKICILGNSGSGKSTLAKKLGLDLNIPVYHLDRELLVGNYEKLPLDERIAKHNLLVNKPSWIIDGNYSKDLEPRFQKADLVLFINSSRLVVIPRVLRRTLVSGQDKDTVPQEANRQMLSWKFFKFVVRYNRRKRSKTIKQLCEQYSAKLCIVKNEPPQKMAERVEKFIGENF